MLRYPNCTPIGFIVLFQGPQELNHGCTSHLHLLMNFRNNAGSLALVLMDPKQGDTLKMLRHDGLFTHIIAKWNVMNWGNQFLSHLLGSHFGESDPNRHPQLAL